jgi:phosphoadenosine phosphosulfate reductase
MSDLVARLDAILDPTDPAATLAAFRRVTDGHLVLTTSFGVEDQALTHLVLSQRLDVEIVTIDTGRLFPETYEVWEATERRYGVRIAAIYPEAGEVESLVASQGINGFRHSVEARKACCHARKVAPLTRLLAGASGWITGLRADQSPARGATPLVAWDEAFDLIKLNPLLRWSRRDAVRFTAAHDVPVNALHAQGFLSIGCAPCTRALRPGEDERAGRWWWEQDGKKECGLHVGADGRLARLTEEARP